MSVFRIVRRLDGVTSYLISNGVYSPGTWTRKKFKATVFTEIDVVRKLDHMLMMASPPHYVTASRPSFPDEGNLYYGRPYRCYLLWRFMYGLHGGRTESDAKFFVYDYEDEKAVHGGVLYEADTEPQDMSQYEAFAKNPSTYFSFNEFVMKTANEDECVAAVIAWKNEQIDIGAAINEKMIAGAYRMHVVQEAPMVDRSAFAVIERFVSFILSKDPTMNAQAPYERVLKFSGDGLSSQPEYFRKLLAEYVLLQKAHVALQEKGLRALYKQNRNRK